MARKRYSDEDALKLLREIDVHLHDGLDVVSACRKSPAIDAVMAATKRIDAENLERYRIELSKWQEADENRPPLPPSCHLYLSDV